LRGVKITPADKAFSKCIRIRANWTCERCFNQFFPPATGGLDCSHHHSRGNWSIRLDPLNAEALCYGCHSHVGGTQERREKVLSTRIIDILFEKKRDTGLGREYRKTKGVGLIAKYYREEFQRMQELREQGETGRIEFVGYI